MFGSQKLLVPLSPSYRANRNMLARLTAQVIHNISQSVFLNLFSTSAFTPIFVLDFTPCHSINSFKKVLKIFPS